jgi:hypothetical protein
MAATNTLRHRNLKQFFRVAMFADRRINLFLSCKQLQNGVLCSESTLQQVDFKNKPFLIFHFSQTASTASYFELLHNSVKNLFQVLSTPFLKTTWLSGNMATLKIDL